MAKQRIGFVGIGNMGVPMSANIARAGFPLTLFDADGDVARRHAEAIGARHAGSLGELGEACDIVVTMLPTGAIVRQIMLDGGLATALGRGSMAIDMSSSEPIGTRDLGKELAQKMGVVLVDAPVSGAVPRAREGSLTIMLGSEDADAAERATPVLTAMGNRVFRTGGLGSGHAMKALNNYVAAAGTAAAMEAIMLAKRFGLDPQTAVEIFNVSTGRNFCTENVLGKHVVGGDFASGFQLGLLAKDVGIAAGLAEALNAPLPLVAETSRWWAQARDGIGAAEDHTTAYRFWEKAANR